jgi:1-pyrroline-5-carboxylate dehydrogenase
MAAERIEIPIIIGGKEFRTGELGHAVMPHAHAHVLADYHKAKAEHVRLAVDTAVKAQREWSQWPWEDRVAVFLRAAELLATTWRDTLNAATMLGQSKTVFQAEIDAACELIDFWRMNALYAQEIYADQPMSSTGVWLLDYRAFEASSTPSRHSTSRRSVQPRRCAGQRWGTAVWKPAATAMLSGYYVMRILEEAGLPPGVINFVPGDPVMISEHVLTHRDLAGVHFTGSTGVFNSMWKAIGANMGSYKSYPRIVGETGGKDFIVAHPSADPAAVAVAIARGGFEYQGQKCSAASRAYVPRSMWNEVRDRTVAMMGEIRMGDVRDFRNFMGAVIDKKAFDRISEYLADARKNARVIAGGTAKDDTGYFIEPTLIESPEPGYRLMCEEIFGPVVTVSVYDDAEWLETLQTVDSTSPYALTGSIFSREREGVRDAMVTLRNSAGNFYINDKPTGAVVGQQPFGGARASGTNDKAGSKLNLLRWISPRTIKETFVPPTDYRYPFMGAE